MKKVSRGVGITASFITLVLGAIVLWIAASLSENLRFFIEGNNNIDEHVGKLLIMAGSVVFLIGFSGFGVCLYLDPSALIVFGLATLFWAACLMGGGAVFMRLGEISGMKIEDSVDIQDIDSLYNRAASILCTVYCPCDLKNPENYMLTASETKIAGGAINSFECDPCQFVGEYTQSEKTEVQRFFDQYFPGQTVELCTVTSQNIVNNYLDWSEEDLERVEWMEDTFDCAGISKYRRFRYFSDINEGANPSTCRIELADEVIDVLSTQGISLICISLYLVFFT